MHQQSPVMLDDFALQRTCPLCLDLDGTLVRTDTLYELLLAALKSSPLKLLALPLWLFKGKAHFKRQLCRYASISAAGLPYRTELVNWARRQATVREVYLATAAHQSIAAPIAAHLQIFKGVFSTEYTNLDGERKASALVAAFGKGGFDYAGNSAADLPIWQQSAGAILVDTPRNVARRAESGGNVIGQLDPPGERVQSSLRLWMRQLRLYQWIKNLLLFVAPIAAHSLLKDGSLLREAVAFLSFGCTASAVYVVNDLLDLDVDRAHPRKRERPFARGDIPIWQGFVAAPIMIALGLALGALLGVGFFAVVVSYLVMTSSYSMFLKRKAFADVAMLATLYTWRVFAGAVASGFLLSFWLLALCAYGFLSLALLKRFSELVGIAPGATTHGRDYLSVDTTVVAALGAASGMVASLVTALYIESESGRAAYSHPEYLWALVGLMTLGLGRLWITAGRGRMADDPIVFIAKDRYMLCLLALGMITVWLAV
jgi:4-hydroxybenzoate polyprenyltransferase